MRYRPILPIAVLLLAATQAMAAEPRVSPTYTADGRLQWPADFREWIFLSAGIDMSYGVKADPPGHSVFDNVFVNPEAYREFKRTGTWPDPTILVLDVRGAAIHGSINRHGKFQRGESVAVEVHVKDTKHLAGGWGFFAFDGTSPATQLPVTAPCYSCHQQHAAVDTTFVQFYPTLLGTAVQKGTLAAGYKP